MYSNDVCLGPLAFTIEKKHGASRAVMIKAANTVALPSLMWALEAYPMTTNCLLKLQTCFMKVLRTIFICHIPNPKDNWISRHQWIRSYIRKGLIESPAMILYQRQERLYLFLQSHATYDMNLLLQWRNLAWLNQLDRRSRPSRRISGTPPRSLELEFLDRHTYSVKFRALRYSEIHCVMPF